MAFSGIPLPKVVSDVGPGGPLVSALQGINALQKSNIENKYLPMTTQAEAASKLAYANLMGPQFLAKLMGNPDILASMNNAPEAVKLLQRAGMGQSTGTNAINNPALAGVMNPQNQNPLTMLVDKIRGAFGFGQQQPISNALAIQQPNLSPQDRQNISNMQPGQAYTIQGNQGQNQPGIGVNSGMSFDKYGNNIVASPEEIERIANQGNVPPDNLSMAEKVGKYTGIKEEGKEAGKIRAKDIQDLNDVYFNAQTKQSTLDDINGMLASPEIREIRQLPLAGRHEMGYYAKFGTPDQQQLVGRLYAQMGNIVKDSSRDFAGQFRKGEQALLQGMKPNDSDTVDTMIGKAESLSLMNKMLAERARLTSQYMSQYHVNKLQASEMADKNFNGDKIRQEVHNILNPKPTDIDIKHMADKYKITEDEVKRRLKAKGVL